MDFLETLIERVIAASDVLIAAVVGITTVTGVFQLIFVGVNVIIVLITLYMRPIKTRKQLVIVLLSVLAAFAICCMTLWLYFQSVKGVL